MKNMNFAVSILLIIISSCVSFYGGIQYQQSKSPARQYAGRMGSRFNGADAQGGQNNARFRGNFINGEVIKKDEKSLTVKLSDGGSRIVLLTASTSIMKSDEGSAGDIEIGKIVMINGEANSDGSVNAQMVQLRDGNLPSSRQAQE